MFGHDQCVPYQQWAMLGEKSLISLDMKAFMDLDEDARVRACMGAGLAFPDHLDQFRGYTGWLTVLEPLNGNPELTLKVSKLIQWEMDAQADVLGTISEEHKKRFISGWLKAAKDIRRGKDNTELVSLKCSPWFYSGYNAAFNRWNGTITKYAKLGIEWGCEDPKGLKEGEDR